MVKNISILLLAILSFSCAESEKDKLARTVTEWQGKEIVFPEQVAFTRIGSDSVDYSIPDTKYKILIYVDSIGCASCKLQLPRWKSFIAYLDSVCEEPVPVLFFLHPKDEKEVNYLLRRDRFTYPVCVDKHDSLNLLNKFPSVTALQTFLLDADNRVEAIGNPIHNERIKDLYLTILTGKGSPETQQKQTSVTVESPEVDFGKFSSKETKEAVFSFKNTGTSPLVVVDVNTTCGCAAAEYDKQPAKPGETLTVKIKYTPKGAGLFKETATVRCNAASSPVKLTIRGEAQ